MNKFNFCYRFGGFSPARAPRNAMVPRPVGPLSSRREAVERVPPRELSRAGERPQAGLLRAVVLGQNGDQPLQNHGCLRRLLHRRQAVRFFKRFGGVLHRLQRFAEEGEAGASRAAAGTSK